MPEDVSQFLAANVHVTTAGLLEDARRAAEREGKVLKTGPRPGQVGVEASRFDLGDGDFLWVAADGPREARVTIHCEDMLHAEFQGSMLVLVDDSGLSYAAVA